MRWSGGIAEWTENDTAYISVAFSWKLQEAYMRAVWHKSNGMRVRVGGGGVFIQNKQGYRMGLRTTRAARHGTKYIGEKADD